MKMWRRYGVRETVATHTHTHTCTYTHIHAHTHTYAHTRTRAHAHTNTHSLISQRNTNEWTRLFAVCLIEI